MFYVFQTQIYSWRNSELQAVPQHPVPEFKFDWWIAEPFTSPPSLPIFAISSKAPKLDIYFTGTLVFDLYSAKFIDLLQRHDIKFETFPVMVRDKKTREILPIKYEALHLLEAYPVLDEDRSVINKEIFRIEKLILKEESQNLQRLMFRIKELPNIILIHQELKEKLDSLTITGYICYPVDGYVER